MRLEKVAIALRGCNNAWSMTPCQNRIRDEQHFAHDQLTEGSEVSAIVKESIGLIQSLARLRQRVWNKPSETVERIDYSL